MAAVPHLPTTARARLTHHDSRLDGVQVLPAGTPLPPWRISHLNAPMLRLAQVVNMAKVFEDFVSTAPREALTQYPGHTESQHRAYLDTDRIIPMRSAYPPALHDLVDTAVAIARSHPDEYIRHRVECQVRE